MEKLELRGADPTEAASHIHPVKKVAQQSSSANAWLFIEPKSTFFSITLEVSWLTKEL
jgi:hypothetical protein